MPNEKQTPLQEFARLIGSKKGTHPIPPDQYLTYQDKRYPPATRMWSLFVQCSIAPGHRTGPATYQNRPLTVAIAGKLLKLDKGNAQAAWRQNEREGRLRKDAEGQIWIAGDFQLPGSVKVTEVCTNLFPSFYMKEINKLPEHLRDSLNDEELRDREKRDIVIADAVAAARFIFDQRQNSRLARYGVNIKRQKHKPPKGKETERAERQRRLADLLPAVERYVQTTITTETVQSSQTIVPTQAKAPETAATNQPQMTSEKAPGVPSQSRERFENKPVSEWVKPQAHTHPLPAVSDENRNTPAVQAEALRAMLNRTLAGKLKKVPDTRIVWLVLEKLGQATVQSLEERIMLRLDAITSYGMIPALAADAAAAPQEPAEAKPATKKMPNWQKELYAEREKAS
jgi:hypothetical protein